MPEFEESKGFQMKNMEYWKAKHNNTPNKFFGGGRSRLAGAVGGLMGGGLAGAMGMGRMGRAAGAAAGGMLGGGGGGGMWSSLTGGGFGARARGRATRGAAVSGDVGPGGVNMAQAAGARRGVPGGGAANAGGRRNRRAVLGGSQMMRGAMRR